MENDREIKQIRFHLNKTRLTKSQNKSKKSQERRYRGHYKGINKNERSSKRQTESIQYQTFRYMQGKEMYKRELKSSKNAKC